VIYPFLKDIHSVMRWVVLILAVWALFRMWRGSVSGAAWRKADQMSGLAFTSFLNLQVLVGLVLYATSPITHAAMANFAAAMKDPILRFYAVEHSTGMILAAVIAQVGYSISKRATTDGTKFMRAAISYSVAVLIVIASIPWPFFKYGRPLFPGFGG